MERGRNCADFAVAAASGGTTASPLTASDVQCTWEMLTGKSDDKLRVNPRKSWYSNLGEVTTNGDYEVVFHF